MSTKNKNINARVTIGSLPPSSVFFIADVGPGRGPPVGPENNLAFGKVHDLASRSAFQSL